MFEHYPIRDRRTEKKPRVCDYIVLETGEEALEFKQGDTTKLLLIPDLKDQLEEARRESHQKKHCKN